MTAHNATPSAIQAIGLIRSFGERRALDGSSLRVRQGSVFGLLGPNGSGKTTFLTMVTGLDKPDGGSLRVFGAPPARQLRSRIGIVFQENTQDALLRPVELLRLVARLYGLGGAGAAKRIATVLAIVGLAGRADDPIATLSGGMRRRLEVARALLHEPDLLILDEPTTGIDPDERRALWDALRAAWGHGMTILLATNDLAEADAVCDEVAFLREGAVVAQGQPAELKRGLAAESVTVTCATAEDAMELSAVAGVATATVTGPTARLTTVDSSSLVPALFVAAPGRIRSVAVDRTTLEDAYFHHVGRRSTAQEKDR
ncbi:MAG: ABC transporter ATP-binding protein [Dehalococcoidia bacterium]